LMSMMHEKVAHMDPDDIINMDQAPILYWNHSKWTFKKREQRQCMSGHPLLILGMRHLLQPSQQAESYSPHAHLNGQSNGQIAKNEFQTYQQIASMSVNQSCWWMKKWWNYGLTWSLFRGKTQGNWAFIVTLFVVTYLNNSIMSCLCILFF
jgi:hypothetical protein